MILNPTIAQITDRHAKIDGRHPQDDGDGMSCIGCGVTVRVDMSEYVWENGVTTCNDCAHQERDQLVVDVGVALRELAKTAERAHDLANAVMAEQGRVDELHEVADNALALVTSYLEADGPCVDCGGGECGNCEGRGYGVDGHGEDVACPDCKGMGTAEHEVDCRLGALAALARTALRRS